VVNQRLVRTICENCRVGFKADETVIRALKLDPSEHHDLTLYRGRGCASCFHSGYHGRTGIYEVMDVSELIRELILLQTTKEVIRQVARDEGMKTLREAAITKVIQGVTTVEEMYRVTL
jgi:type IV pilus assembly protein PilB